MIDFTYNPSGIVWTLLILTAWIIGRPYFKRFLERDMLRQQEKYQKRMEEEERLRREEEERERLEGISEDDSEEDSETEELLAEEKPVQSRKTQ
ncbi:hypothetical protein K493DRAFT_316022 [Basidiobolus meristosporus CBS 931.73]|uniref:Uncharacterized protein n=1 Tax=Basidiobolus meristosporus CBS 931.73 TaxID=1314790 RepID=A0A1Y1Y5Z5_9FUNG|nr:hypothetical protein K493DRAFT_316022 [Basidiobolus meristosporus CBS 931.73]|eukprot:ORX93450.1 hypothetical protein K493DRAFT_316022 [Basidiobolus meristosporus CBS 931.73]